VVLVNLNVTAVHGIDDAQFVQEDGVFTNKKLPRMVAQ
jgi:hypothetical protein